MSETYWRRMAFRTGRPDAITGCLSILAAGHCIAGREFQETGGRRETVELIWCKSGRGRILNYGKEIKMASGDVFFYLPGSYRRLSGVDSGWDFYWLICDGPDLDAVIRNFKLKQELREAGGCPESRFTAVIESLRRIDAAGAIQAAAAAYEIMLLALNPAARETAPRELTARFQAMVEKQYADPDFSVQAAAKTLAVHRSTLHRAFYARHGISPQSYLNSYRLRQALELLHSGMNVKEIAEHCGFNAPHYFAKVFRACFGQNPSEFRQTLMTAPPLLLFSQEKKQGSF